MWGSTAIGGGGLWCVERKEVYCLASCRGPSREDAWPAGIELTSHQRPKEKKARV